MLDPWRFLATDTDPAGIPVRPEEAAVPDALLRVLGPLPLVLELNRTRRYGVAEVTRWGRTFRVHQRVEETAEQVLTRFYQTVSAARPAGPGRALPRVPGRAAARHAVPRAAGRR